MSLNFITPDRIVEQTTISFKRLGLNIDVDAMCDEMSQSFNSDYQRRYAETCVGHLIPAALPVCISSLKASREVFVKYGVPDFSSAPVAAAIAFNIDSTHPYVLILNEEYLDNETVIRHELVHFDQISRGDLVYSDTGDIIWTKAGEECKISGIEDMVKKYSIASERDALLLHEIQSRGS